MKKLIGMILAIAMLVTLAACTPKTETAQPKETDSPETTQPAQKEDPAKPDGSGTADYSGKTVSICYNPDDTWKDIIDNYAMPAFEKNFPGLKVELTPFDTATTAETLVAVGEFPDIFFGPVSVALIQSKALLDQAPYLNDWMDENFNNPNFYRDGNGSVWASGAGTDTFYTSVYYYNVDIFNELGLKAPASFDELLATCQTLKDAGYKTPLSHSGWSASVYMMEQAIISYDPSAYADLVANKTDFNDPRILAAMENIQKMIDSGALGKGTAEKDMTVSISEFVQGDAPIMSTMSWNTASIAGQTDFEVGQFFFPTANPKYPNGENYSCWGSFLNGWQVNAETEDPQLTTDVLKVLIEQEAQRNFDQGLITNYLIDGDFKFVNELDTARYEMFQKVQNWYPAFFPNALDAAATSTYNSLIAEWLMDDSDLDAKGFCEGMQAAWEENTFFDVFQ